MPSCGFRGGCRYAIGSADPRPGARSAQLHAVASVAPNKHGECVQFEVQKFFQGSWQFLNLSTRCIALNNSSQAFANFSLTQADLGFPLRSRADYIHSASDITDQSADGSWLYFEVRA